MKIDAIFNILMQIKQDALDLEVVLTNDEILQIMLIKSIMELKGVLSR